jgi:phospholipid/cholesterol/gamma-HCH transport system substrate-binding protein
MTEPFKFRRVNEITGVFVIAVLVVLIAAIVWTARSQRWFKSTVALRIVLPEAGAAGIRQGSEVYFLGTLVGSVSDVLVEKTGRMEAHTRVRRDFFRFVRADSSAVVKKKFGVAGDAFFEITRGVGKTLPEENASIVCNEQFQSGFESAIEEIRSESVLVLKKAKSSLAVWSELGAELSETRAKVDELTARWDRVMADIENGAGTVGKLINNSSLADETLGLLANANAAVSESRGMMTNLSNAALSLQNGAANLPEIGNALAAEAKDLPGLVQQTQTSMRELERLIVAMQRHWILRKYVRETKLSEQPKIDGATKAATTQVLRK